MDQKIRHLQISHSFVGTHSTKLSNQFSTQSNKFFSLQGKTVRIRSIATQKSLKFPYQMSVEILVPILKEKKLKRKFLIYKLTGSRTIFILAKV